MKLITAISTALCLILLLSTAVAAQGSVYLSYVDGYDGMGLMANTTVTFHISLSNQTGEAVTGLAHGFQLISPNGATWSQPTGEWSPALQPVCDLVFSVAQFGDTIGFGCVTLFNPGLPDGFDQEAMRISTRIDMSSMGKTVCLDTAFFPPGGVWMWSTSSGSYSPGWDGPHCYEVTNFTWLCADIDNNGTIADIADLSYLVDFMFHGGPPPLFPFAPDVNGDGTVDITDLTYLVEYMFLGGPLPICF
ncbi:MAG: dockerin type I repeat-containing protein [bacterium]|nr:dockerin type I repeat-containing protein [bacterium]